MDGDSQRGATLHIKKAGKPKSSPPPLFRGTRRSWRSSASPTARPGAAARPPRGLSRIRPCAAPGRCRVPRRCMRGEWVAHAGLVSGGGALSRRGLVWGEKAGRRWLHYRWLKNVAAQTPRGNPPPSPQRPEKPGGSSVRRA